MCLSGRCSMCINSKEETKQMVDLTKPLTVKDWGDFHYIGKNRQGELVVESAGGVMHRVSATTFRFLTTADRENHYLENKLEPWEQAWKEAKCRDSYLMEKEYFKYVFELGRSWKK
jgi:hypothetical protein